MREENKHIGVLFASPLLASPLLASPLLASPLLASPLLAPLYLTLAVLFINFSTKEMTVTQFQNDIALKRHSL